MGERYDGIVEAAGSIPACSTNPLVSNVRMIDKCNPEEIVSTEWDLGKRSRRLVAHICDQCRARFFAPRHTNSQFCGKACKFKARERRVQLTCAQCRIVFERPLNKLRYSRSGIPFCTRSCKDKAQRLEGIPQIHPAHYGSAVLNKEQLIRLRGHRCEECSLTEWRGQSIPLEVHHRDGNPYNDDPLNHRLVCCNCHALTPSWRGRNKGSGRKSRGVVAQLGERYVRNVEAAGSIPVDSTDSS